CVSYHCADWLTCLPRHRKFSYLLINIGKPVNRAQKIQLSILTVTQPTSIVNATALQSSQLCRVNAMVSRARDPTFLWLLPKNHRYVSAPRTRADRTRRRILWLMPRQSEN